MNKNTSISLGEHFNSFIDEQLNSGRFNSTSEVVRAGLRLLEDNESKLAILRSNKFWIFRYTDLLLLRPPK